MLACSLPNNFNGLRRTTINQQTLSHFEQPSNARNGSTLNEFWAGLALEAKLKKTKPYYRGSKQQLSLHTSKDTLSARTSWCVFETQKYPRPFDRICSRTPDTVCDGVPKVCSPKRSTSSSFVFISLVSVCDWSNL